MKYYKLRKWIYTLFVILYTITLTPRNLNHNVILHGLDLNCSLAEHLWLMHASFLTPYIAIHIFRNAKTIVRIIRYKMN